MSEYKPTDQLIQELEQANTQLLQSEKLAAIGQLAAGVAHEINNPIGYVFSNLKSLGDYVQDLLQIADAADEVNSLEELRALKARLDYEFLRKDIGALLNESAEGITRIKGIITALKDFSHIDDEDFRSADLHDSLESTLNLVNNELKYKAEVIKSYDPELPEIECLPSQIKQVMLNLLTNAVQAIERKGRITLRTGRQSGEVWFEVEDDGQGIAPEHHKRLFDPFFTTKPVGEGTGLGLALSHSIVQKHGGRIEVDSVPSSGSRFRVWLPIVQQSCEVVPAQ